MLFDLRVVLAACLATFLFAAIGLGLLASSRSPFRAPAGYAANEGRSLAGPGLPKSRPLPLPETTEPETPEPETTGAIAAAPEAAPPEPVKPEKAAKATKTAPLAAKKQSITSLIEEDKAQRENATKEEAKKAAAKKKPRQVRHRPKQPPKPTSPWSVFTNNNNTTTAR